MGKKKLLTGVALGRLMHLARHGTGEERAEAKAELAKHREAAAQAAAKGTSSGITGGSDGGDNISLGGTT